MARRRRTPGKPFHPATLKSRVKVRRFWRINPQTRVKPSLKRYSRRRIKKELLEVIKEEDVSA